MKDELGIEVTPERIEELKGHFMFGSDTLSRDVCLVLDAQQAEIERLSRRRPCRCPACPIECE